MGLPILSWIQSCFPFFLSGKEFPFSIQSGRSENGNVWKTGNGNGKAGSELESPVQPLKKRTFGWGPIAWSQSLPCGCGSTDTARVLGRWWDNAHAARAWCYIHNRVYWWEQRWTKYFIRLN